MWNEINSEEKLRCFIDVIKSFHDSCLKELHYVSGAYVEENLSMHPINAQRSLRVVFQQQFEEHSMIELEFCGLKYLKLFPVENQFTCEILDSTLLINDDNIYWADCGGLSADELDKYDGTVICASKLRWRSISGFLGKESFYISPI